MDHGSEMDYGFLRSFRNWCKNDCRPRTVVVAKNRWSVGNSWLSLSLFFQRNEHQNQLNSQKNQISKYCIIYSVNFLLEGVAFVELFLFFLLAEFNSISLFVLGIRIFIKQHITIAKNFYSIPHIGVLYIVWHENFLYN